MRLSVLALALLCACLPLCCHRQPGREPYAPSAAEPARNRMLSGLSAGEGKRRRRPDTPPLLMLHWMIWAGKGLGFAVGQKALVRENGDVEITVRDRTGEFPALLDANEIAALREFVRAPDLNASLLIQGKPLVLKFYPNASRIPYPKALDKVILEGSDFYPEEKRQLRAGEDTRREPH